MTTRFDLNAALENWRVELAVQPGLSPDDRRELETHLRDTFAELKSRGLSEEESFWLARRRVGQPQKLAAEFVKADPAQVWRERAFWMMVAAVGFYIWNALYSGLFNILTASPHPENRSPDTGVLPVLIWSLVLPFALTMISLASGRICGWLEKISSFFNSSIRLGICLAMMVIGSYLFCSWGMWWHLRATGASAPSGTIYIFIRTGLIMELVPFTLAILLARLFSKRKNKLLKHS
jgi:hypothetical protein